MTRSAAGSPSAPIVREELARATAVLSAAGVPTPRLDAELLLAESLGVSRAGLVSAAREPVPEAAATCFAALLARRERREPVAYLLGRRAFRRLELHVDSRVLIPRPETEVLVEVGLSLSPGARVVDVGTGSGAVALALKDERPDLSVVGLDIDPEALKVARANGERLGLAVDWVCGDLLERFTGRADAVLANLPYVARGAAVDPEVAGFEPPAAVFAEGEGLAAIRRLVGQAAGREDVWLLALEIGFDQADAVAALMEEAGFGGVERRRDLAGIERVIVGRRA
jgi:release factor glutamine methyltransferase